MSDGLSRLSLFTSDSQGLCFLIVCLSVLSNLLLSVLSNGLPILMSDGLSLLMSDGPYFLMSDSLIYI